MNFLLYTTFAIWVVAGLADWWCHKRTRIEVTSGVRESCFHLFLFLQAGVCVVVGALLEINLLVLVLFGFFFVLHEATTWFELRWVAKKRPLFAGEQMVHSFLELMPLFMLMCLIALHLEAIGRVSSLNQWSLQWKANPLPPGHLAVSAAAVVFLNLLPLLEELRRCVRARRAASLTRVERS